MLLQMAGSPLRRHIFKIQMAKANDSCLHSVNFSQSRQKKDNVVSWPVVAVSQLHLTV